MDERELLTLARQLVASLERKLAAAGKTKAVVKPVANTPPRQKAKAATFAQLPKNKQAYITKKQNEYKNIFKRDWANIPQRDVTKYIKEATEQCIRFALIYTPKPALKLWKEYVDEAFEKLVEVESDDEEDEDEEDEE